MEIGLYGVPPFLKVWVSHNALKLIIPFIEPLICPLFQMILICSPHIAKAVIYRVGQKKLRQIFLAITLVNMDRF